MNNLETDSSLLRVIEFEKKMTKHDEDWELDALPPHILRLCFKHEASGTRVYKVLLQCCVLDMGLLTTQETRTFRPEHPTKTARIF